MRKVECDRLYVDDKAFGGVRFGTVLLLGLFSDPLAWLGVNSGLSCVWKMDGSDGLFGVELRCKAGESDG